MRSAALVFALAFIAAPGLAASVPVWTNPVTYVNGTSNVNTTETDSSLRIITTTAATTPTGPVSQAIVTNGFIFVSGQLPTSPDTGKILGNEITAQTNAALANLKGILEAAGSNLGKVIMCHVYLKSIDDYAQMSQVYGQFFGNHKPARLALSVANIPTGALVEIEATARA